MAKTYTLQGTVNAGFSTRWTDDDWREYTTANSLSGDDNKRRIVGKYNSNYRAVNITFDSTQLAALRAKTVTSVSLTVKLLVGEVAANSNLYKIGFKKNATASSSSTSADAYARESGSTTNGYVHKASSKMTAGNTYTITSTDGLSQSVPSYGYAIGVSQSATSYIILDTTATLTVTTNETDYSITLSYNANGGSGGPSAETKTGTASGTPSVAFTVSSTTPTKSSTTTYTVTYNANGGGVSPPSATATKTTNYPFSKWNTNSGGSGNNYVGGNTITLSSSATLYAQYASPTSTTTSVVLPTPTLTGYTFNGWYTSGGTKVGNAGASYTPSGNITLYAQWTIVKYTVSYNANGGDASTVPASQTKDYGATLTLRSTTPTRANGTTTYTVTYNANGGSVGTASATATKTTTYPFSKWNTAANGSGTNYAAGASYTANANATMYAQWTSSASTTSVTLPTPSLTGYAFNGWYTAASGGTKIGNAGASYTPTATITLYAQWAKNTYTVRYAKNTTATVSNMPSNQTKTQGVDLTLSSNVPTLSGYTFKGWATSESGSVAYAAGGQYTANADINLYAVWWADKATLSTVSNTIIGSTGTATWSIPDSTYTYNLKLSYTGAADVSYNIAATSEAYKTFTFTIPDTWLSALPNTTSATATATLTTSRDGTSLGSATKTFTVFVDSSVEPTIYSFTETHKSSNSTVTGWATYTQGYSYARLAVSATAGTGASVSSIMFDGPGIHTTGTATTIDTSVFDSSGTKPYTVTVTDSRGRTKSSTVTVTVYAYSKPTISSIGTYRCDSDGTINNGSGTYMKFLPKFSASSVNSNNSVQSAKLKWRVSGGSWSSEINVTNDTYTAVLGSGNIDITKTYEVSVTVTDKLNSTTVIATLPGASGIWYGRGNDRIGFGSAPPSAGLHCDWDATFNGVLDVTQRRSYATLPSAGWYRVMKMAGSNIYEAEGGEGFIVDFNIVRNVDTANNEAHKISLIATWGNIKFINEQSVSNVLGITKIRTTYSGSNLYVDVYYELLTTNTVTVAFDVTCHCGYEGKFNSQPFTSVDPSPVGETEVALYTFAANSEIRSFYAGSFSGSSDEEVISQACEAVRTKYPKDFGKDDNTPFPISFFRQGAWEFVGTGWIRVSTVYMVVGTFYTGKSFLVSQSSSGATPTIKTITYQ